MIQETKTCDYCRRKCDPSIPKRRPILVPCGHTFCAECLFTLTSTSCPSCKTPLDQPAQPTSNLIVLDLGPLAANQDPNKPIEGKRSSENQTCKRVRTAATSFEWFEIQYLHLNPPNFVKVF